MYFIQIWVKFTMENALLLTIILLFAELFEGGALVRDALHEVGMILVPHGCG
jgi:hypothetical protein